MESQHGQDVPAKRRQHSDDFKRDAVRMVVETAYSNRRRNDEIKLAKRGLVDLLQNHFAKRLPDADVTSLKKLYQGL